MFVINWLKKLIKSLSAFNPNTFGNFFLFKFPSEKRDEAIQQSVELLNRENFKKYKVIDLRIDGKIVVE